MIMLKLLTCVSYTNLDSLDMCYRRVDGFYLGLLFVSYSDSLSATFCPFRGLVEICRDMLIWLRDGADLSTMNKSPAHDVSTVWRFHYM